MTKRLFGSIAILAACLFVVGCFESDDSDEGAGGTGGNNNAQQCEFTPCGGDIVGTWNGQSACMVSVGMYPECENATISGNPTINGTLVFGADGTYTREGTISGSTRFTIDDACAGAMSPGFNAQTYCAFIDGMAQSGSLGFSGTCDASGSSCSCDLDFEAIDENDSGTYTVSGSTITAGDDVVQYCVTGNELKILTEGGVQTYTK